MGVDIGGEFSTRFVSESAFGAEAHMSTLPVMFGGFLKMQDLMSVSLKSQKVLRSPTLLLRRVLFLNPPFPTASHEDDL
jgi:hypothetical protein